MYDKNAIEKYKGKSLGVLPPHCFAIADKSYRDMKVFKQSQAQIEKNEKLTSVDLLFAKPLTFLGMRS